jgi:hypothetical protein
MASPLPFRVRYGGGAFLPVRLVVGTSEHGVERLVSGRVGLVVGTFISRTLMAHQRPFMPTLKAIMTS